MWREEWSPQREQNLYALVYQLRRRLAALEPGGGARLARALDHFRLAGDLSGQAWTHLSASTAYMMKRDWAEAASQCGRASALFRETGDQPGQRRPPG